MSSIYSTIGAAVGGIANAIESVLGYAIQSMPNTPLTPTPAPTGDKTQVNNIIGLPPQVYNISGQAKPYLINKILQSMLVMDIWPALPKLSGVEADTGLNLYVVDTASGMDQYNSMFSGLSVTPGTFPIKIAVSMENQVSETWDTQFRESTLQGIMNGFSSDMLGEARFASGSRVGSQALQQWAKAFGGSLSNAGGGSSGANIAGNIINKIGNGAAGLAQSVEDMAKSSKNALSAMGGANLLMGSKVDFPKVWVDSTFTPQYSFNCYLINPYPGDAQSYITYIVQPLARILAFMCPVSDSNWTFSFPLICKVSCPGLFGLEGAYMSSLEVVKGGQTNDISFYQQPNIIELRFGFAPLYSTMISRGETNVNEDRPTIDRYLNVLSGTTSFPNDYTGGSTYSSTVKSQLNKNLYQNTSSVTIPVSADPNRIPDNYKEAFTDPIINPSITTAAIRQLYINDFNNLANATIPPLGRTSSTPLLQDRIALQIKYNIPVDANLTAWFWNNFSTFDSTTQSIVNGINPPNSNGVSNTVIPVIQNSFQM